MVSVRQPPVETAGAMLEPLVSFAQSFIEMDDKFAGVEPRLVTCRYCCTWAVLQ